MRWEINSALASAECDLKTAQSKFASGNPSEGSDIGLVVIPHRLKDLDLGERPALLGRARVGIHRAMEILGHADEEFAVASPGTFSSDEVRAKGLRAD
ncbi:MAG TPA: hypothetical protein VM492_13190 [Sumerlaeia bacterium]|nr:hypothetical protein [Sumerlaeia bacterium]